MANMIEHSNFVSVHHLKQEWEDELIKEDDEKIKMGLTKRCMSCHNPPDACDCKDTQFYWSY